MRAIALTLLFVTWSSAIIADPLPPPVLGQTEPSSASRQIELLRHAEQAEREFAPQRAVALYRAAQTEDPTSRLARRAAQRLAWLEARSEAGFAPLSELLRMQARKNPSADELQTLEERVAGFPSGRVRREARAFLAETYLNRLKQPARALTQYQAWLDEPGIDEAERQLATSGIALARAALGDLKGSLAELRAAGLTGRAEMALIELSFLRRWGRPTSFVLIGLFAVLALGCGGFRAFSAAGLRRAFSPARLSLSAYAIGVPFIMARIYSADLERAISPLLVPLSGFLAFASIAGVGLESAELRARARISLCGLGVLAELALAYLVLDTSGVLTTLWLSLRGH